MTQTRKLAGKEVELVEATVKGAPSRAIARQEGVHHATVQREQAKLREVIAAAREAGTLRTLDGIVSSLERLLDLATEAAEEAKTAGDWKLVLQAVRETRDTFARIADLMGHGSASKRDSVTVNVGVSTLVQTHAVTEDEIRTVVELREWPKLPREERRALLLAELKGLDDEGSGEDE